MPKKFLATVTLALGLLLLGGGKASARSGFDPSAVDFLTAGYQYAADAYDSSGTPEAYYAYLCAYYAQYYADFADNADDPGSWFDAYYFGYYAYLYASDDYDATGNFSSYYAMYYLSYGYNYAYDAYIYFE